VEYVESTWNLWGRVKYTRSLVRNSSDAKSNLGYMSDERERAGLTVASGDRMKMIM
jgi:hypothetical protein